MRNLSLLVITFIVTTLSCTPEKEIQIDEVKENRVQVNRSSLKEKPAFNSKFMSLYQDPAIKNLTMIGKVNKFGVVGYQGKILRSLRFKNVSDAVEHRYNLPQGIIFAMMIQESSGMDLLPNGLGDGGFGLCHMQPVVAHEFDLKIYDNCRAMVCNGRDRRSCKVPGGKANHAKKLTNELIAKKYDKKLLYHLDDRLHPVYNLDVVGRMIAYHMDGKLIKGHGPLRTAICRYSGGPNYNKYWKNLLKIMSLVNNLEYMKKLERDFNVLNPDLRINGKPANFRIYIQAMQQQNLNYGLESYGNLPLIEPKNSKTVLSSINNFIK